MNPAPLPSVDGGRYDRRDEGMTVHVESLGPAEIDSRADQQMVPMRDGVVLATDIYSG
jgi:predicted acyl esterase